MATKTKTNTEQKFEALPFNFEPDERLLDPKFVAKVAEAANEEDAKPTEVADRFDIPVHFVVKAQAINEHGLIPFRTETELKKAIAKARKKDNQSWSQICGRLGNMGGHRVRSLYEDATSEPHYEHGIGKGGRPRGRPRSNGQTDAKPKEKTKAKGKQAASKTKKAADKGKGKAKAKAQAVPTFSDEPTTEEVAGALNGKTVTVKKGKSTTDIEVSEVKAVKQAKSGRWGAKVATADNSEKTFPLDAITALN